jgi:hypothetical protein
MFNLEIINEASILIKIVPVIHINKLPVLQFPSGKVYGIFDTSLKLFL